MATAGHPARLRVPPWARSSGQSALYGAFCVQLLASHPPVGVVPSGGHCVKRLPGASGPGAPSRRSQADRRAAIASGESCGHARRRLSRSAARS